MKKKEINFTFANGRSRIILMTDKQLENFERNLNSGKPFWKFDNFSFNVNHVVFYEELEEGLV